MSINSKQIKYNQHRGFGLLEVLITIVILAIGLLGLAGLQATSLNYNHSAYNRTQASLLVYDIVDRMRANQAGINNYLTPGSPSNIASCKTVAGCSASSMAQVDLFEWNQAINDSLPSGAGAITQAGSVFTVSITWDDDRDGNNTNNPSFQASFQP